MSELSDYGIADYVSREFILAGVKGQLRLREQTDDDIWLMDYINMGVKALRNNGTYIPMIAQIPIEDFKAKLPCGFYKFVKDWPIVFVDASGEISSDTVWNAPQFINNTFWECSPYPNIDWSYGGSVTLVDGWLNFSADIDAEYCKISYTGTNIDVNGNVRIPAIAERALNEFAQYMYKRSYAERYSPGIIADHKTLWGKGKKQLKIAFNSPGSLQKQAISATIRSLV